MAAAARSNAAGLRVAAVAALAALHSGSQPPAHVTEVLRACPHSPLTREALGILALS